ncbi:mitochondrial ribosome assembly protein RRG9, partial [Aspergillus homomorphus CBS 101889]
AVSVRTSLSSILREAFHSEVAPSTRRLSERRSFYPITPLAYRKPGAQRNFSSTHQIQIHQSRALLSSDHTPENVPDATQPIQTKSLAKNDRGEKPTDNVTPDGNTSGSFPRRQRAAPKRRMDKGDSRRGSAKTSRSKTDTRGDGLESNPSEEKPKATRKTWRESFKDKASPKKKEDWQVQKDALKNKFKEGWNPPKKLSPDAMEGIRHLHQMAPDRFTTPVLAEQFKVSPEAIRRILKSKWRASDKEMEDRRKRWERRHDRIWAHMAELGLRPSKKETQKYQDSHVL